jgi:hypothetical protein
MKFTTLARKHAKCKEPSEVAHAKWLRENSVAGGKIRVIQMNGFIEKACRRHGARIGACAPGRTSNL